MPSLYITVILFINVTAHCFVSVLSVLHGPPGCLLALHLMGGPHVLWVAPTPAQPGFNLM